MQQPTSPPYQYGTPLNPSFPKTLNSQSSFGQSGSAFQQFNHMEEKQPMVNGIHNIESSSVPSSESQVNGPSFNNHQNSGMTDNIGFKTNQQYGANSQNLLHNNPVSTGPMTFNSNIQSSLKNNSILPPTSSFENLMQQRNAPIQPPIKKTEPTFVQQPIGFNVNTTSPSINKGIPAMSTNKEFQSFNPLNGFQNSASSAFQAPGGAVSKISPSSSFSTPTSSIDNTNKPSAFQTSGSAINKNQSFGNITQSTSTPNNAISPPFSNKNMVQSSQSGASTPGNGPQNMATSNSGQFQSSLSWATGTSTISSSPLTTSVIQPPSFANSGLSSNTERPPSGNINQPPFKANNEIPTSFSSTEHIKQPQAFTGFQTNNSAYNFGAPSVSSASLQTSSSTGNLMQSPVSNNSTGLDPPIFKTMNPSRKNSQSTTDLKSTTSTSGIQTSTSSRPGSTGISTGGSMPPSSGIDSLISRPGALTTVPLNSTSGTPLVSSNAGHQPLTSTTDTKTSFFTGGIQTPFSTGNLTHASGKMMIQPLIPSGNGMQPPMSTNMGLNPSPSSGTGMQPPMSTNTGLNPSLLSRNGMQPTSVNNGMNKPPFSMYSSNSASLSGNGLLTSQSPATNTFQPPSFSSNNVQPRMQQPPFPSSGNQSMYPSNNVMQPPIPMKPTTQPALPSSNSMQGNNFSTVQQIPQASGTTQFPNIPPSFPNSNITTQPRPVMNSTIQAKPGVSRYPKYPTTQFQQTPNTMPPQQFQPPMQHSNNSSNQNVNNVPNSYQPQPNIPNNLPRPIQGGGVRGGMPPMKQPVYQQNTGYQSQSQPQTQQQQQQQQQQQLYQSQYQQNVTNQFSNMSINQGLNKIWGYEPHDLLNVRNILPSRKVEPPPIRLPQEINESTNCRPDLFRCTLSKIPETKALLDKSRLPLGILLHPFKDINQLKVVKTVIVRCKTCRAYINPFVQFIDTKLWKCNLCFRTNEVHEQFLYDRNTDMYGDPFRRPEIQSATVEYLATADYNVRDPPQPATYVFVLDVSQIAAQSRYLFTFCEVILKQLKSMPGDRRTAIAFITFDSSVHFYSLCEDQALPSQMVISDIDDIFLPSPDNILVNLHECYDVIVELLKQLPNKFKDTMNTGSALGAALQAAYQLIRPTGGRVTVFQTCLPNMGPGALQPRENPNQRSNDEPPHMNPATDFYKKLALECSTVQIAVDLFILNSQYVDLASLSGVSKFSSGCIHHIPLYSEKNISHVYQFERMFTRYLTRKIGFESVMRLRCTRGLSISSFHGNFFVRSTDLLALPNVNPDAGYGIQISIDENLSHIQYACFQTAVLYTSSKGDRRIRVHTLCLPVVSNVNDVLMGADQQCIAGLLSKMAVDRSLQYSLSDAREAFLNVVCDVLTTYKSTQSGHLTGSLLAPSSLKLLPLYILALLKHPAFRIGQSTRLDDRLFAMCEMKSLPLSSLLLSIYPELYPIHTIDQDTTFEWSDVQVPSPPILQLSAERLQATGIYLMNTADAILIIIRHGASPQVCSNLFGFHSVAQMPDVLYDLPRLDNEMSERLNAFISYLNDDKAFITPIRIMKDSSPDRMEFYDRLIEDKNAAGMSYYEFLQRVREQIK